MNAGWLNNYRRSRISRLVDMDSDLDRELVVNGDFATGDLTGWSATAPATIAHSGGTCRITRNSAAFGTDMCYQDVNVVTGNWYLIKFDYVYENTSVTNLELDFSIDGGTTDVAQLKILNTQNNNYQVWQATGDLLRVIFKVADNATGIAGFDNVSLKRIIYSP
jgi:hypothetical protein